MEENHRPHGGETGQRGHELSGLDGAGFRGREDLFGSPLLQLDGVDSILKVLDAKAGWIQEDESKLLLRKGLFSAERGTDESLRQCTTRRLAQIEAASAAALVTMPTATWGTVLKEGARLSKQSEQNLNALLEWQQGARRCRSSTQHPGRGRPGGHQDAVKPVVHPFMETSGSGGDQLGNEGKRN